MLKHPAIALAATVLAASQAGGCGSGSHATTVGASPATVNCTQDPVGDDTGIAISKGLITGTMRLACNGGIPDTYDFTMILVHDGTMLKATGNTPITIPPDSNGTTVQRIADCSPGAWHVYYLVTWTLNGATVHNDTTTTDDRDVTADEC